MKEKLLKETMVAIYDLTHRMGNDYSNPDVELLSEVHFTIAGLSASVLRAVNVLDKAKED